MKITSLQLQAFRNYTQQELSFDPGINLFYGDNAQGKTNILESIYLCGTTKSHRQGKDREMIRFGCEEAHIRMQMEKKEIAYRIDLHLKKNKAKGIAINGVPIRRAGELVGLGNYVFFSPEDLGIIKNGPAERRRFMDMELCQLTKMYVHHLSAYQRVLLQRNRLLKDITFRSDYMPTLDVWDEQLVRYGAEVIRAREAFVSLLNESISTIHSQLTGGKEEMTILYEKDVEIEDFAQELRRGRDTDIHRKTTGKGPHHDDLEIKSNGIDLRRFGSQGQQRTAALSLKLAEIELVKEISKDMPVLLLDDVLSELDAGRRTFLLSSIRNIQTFITCTGIEDFTSNGFSIDRLFYVNNGEVSVKKN